MENLQASLVEVRCPFEKASKRDEAIYKCNRVCVKVTPHSAGEARCRSCHMSFEFKVHEDSTVETGIRVQKIAQ